MGTIGVVELARKAHEILSNIDLAKPRGMQSLDQALAGLVTRNVVTEELFLVVLLRPLQQMTTNPPQMILAQTGGRHYDSQTHGSNESAAPQGIG